MRAVLGVSVGSSVARAAILGAADGGLRSLRVARSFAPDSQVAAAVDLLDSTASAESIATTDCVVAVPNDPAERPHSSAYAVHRDARFSVVSELGAQLRFLRGTGLLDGLGTVAICDIGASGTTVSIVEPATGRVLTSVRTQAFGATVCDRAVRRYLLSTYGADELMSRTAVESLLPAVSSAREQLSSERVAEVPGPFVAGPVRLWRSSFDDIVESAVRCVEDWTASVIVDAPRAVNALVMVGGCAHLPLLRRVFERDLRLPVIVPPTPESLTAHGAALLASDAVGRRTDRPLVSVGSTRSMVETHDYAAYTSMPRHRRSA